MTVPNFVGKYDLGDTIKLRATVLGTDGAVAMPSAFLFLVKNPLGSVASYTWQAAGASILTPGTGAFFKDITILPTTSEVGTWYYRALATGLISTAEEFTFLVQTSNII